MFFILFLPLSQLSNSRLGLQYQQVSISCCENQSRNKFYFWETKKSANQKHCWNFVTWYKITWIHDTNRIKYYYVFWKQHGFLNLDIIFSATSCFVCITCWLLQRNNHKLIACFIYSNYIQIISGKYLSIHN